MQLPWDEHFYEIVIPAWQAHLAAETRLMDAISAKNENARKRAGYDADYGELLITQQLACGRDRNSRIARRSHVDSPVGTQPCRIAGRASVHPVRRGRHNSSRVPGLADSSV